MHNEIESVDLENSQAEELRERLAREEQYDPKEDVPEFGLNGGGYIDKIN